MGADEVICNYTFYFEDADQDEYGNPAVSVEACVQPSGYVTDNTDCDDNDAKEHPSQIWYKDADGDGFSDGITNTTSCFRPVNYKLASELTAISGDCKGNDPDIHPGTTEICGNGVDEDCDDQDDTCPCTVYSISPTSKSFGYSGGSGSIGVTTTSGCSWNASSNASWINITSGSSGSGNGTVSYSVSANTGSSRTGTITIAGKTFTVTQGGGPIGPGSCPESISPVSKSFGSGGGTDNVNVVAPDGCNWTASSSDPSWLIITSGNNGTGDGTVNYSVSPNTGESFRTTEITITGDTSKTFKLNQVGAGAGPAPHIMASGSDASDRSVTSGTSDTLSVSVSLAPGGGSGMD